MKILEQVKSIDWGKMFIGILLYNIVMYIGFKSMSNLRGIDQQIISMIWFVIFFLSYRIIYSSCNGFNKILK